MAAIAVLTLVYVFYNFFRIKGLDEGTDEMIEKADIIREGARTFIRTEFIRIIIVAAIVSLLISLFIERTAGVTFLIGAVISGFVCVLGMEDSTYANVRTANRARITIQGGEKQSLADTLQVALLGGSVPGLSVPACLLLGFVAIWLIYGGPKYDSQGSGLVVTLGAVNASTMRLTTYSLGASVVAMFSRVAGGNYTKAADISSDIVGKNRYGLDEDDARIPNVIADFIGDNVNDIAGNCSDLLESTLATGTATALIAHSLFSKARYAGLAVATEKLYNATTLYPILILGGGLLSSHAGIFDIIQMRKNRKEPSQEINLVTWISAGLTILVSFIITLITFVNVPLYSEFKLGWISPWIATVLGIGAGVAVGLLTEYYTSTEYQPTQALSRIAPEGEAFEVTLGDALGSRSTLLPIVVIGLAIFFSGVLCGTYGVAMAALGMMSFVGATVSIDAFGPIADNAGGLAEACGLDDEVRVVTDQLDAVGNTTAAIGKGFAIGSAALATVSLISAFVESYTPVGQTVLLNFADYRVVAGFLIGGALVKYFEAILAKNTIQAAQIMADDGDAKLKQILNYGADPKPMYKECIKTATEQALKRMVAPSVIALVIPVIAGVLFGKVFVGGLLAGATGVAVGLAIYHGNSGGAFDNAKKLVEQGKLIGYRKNEPREREAYERVHKTVVACDTIGDTRKDVIGVALDIFIKIMSTVAITLVPLFMVFSLF